MTTSHPQPVWVMVRSRDMSEVAELVRAAAEGDQGAWNGLVDRYNVTLYVSPVGEILRAELPGQIVLVNDAISGLRRADQP